MEEVYLERCGFKRLKLCDEFRHFDANYRHCSNANPFMTALFQNFTCSNLLNCMEESINQLIDKFIRDCDVSDCKKNATKSMDYRNRGNQKYASGQLSGASFF